MEAKGITILEKKIGENIHTYLIPQKAAPGEIYDFLYHAICFIEDHIKKSREAKKPEAEQNPVEKVEQKAE